MTLGTKSELNDSTSQALVSIIMPAYNAEKFIREAISSVLNQTYTNWELIIVDDASTDETRNIVEKLVVQDSRIKIFKLNENSGAAAARNKAISEANGEFLSFLDSDDLWEKCKLSKQIEFMESNKYHFSATSYSKIDEDGLDLGTTINAKKVSDYYGLLKTSPGNSTVIYNCKILGKFYISNIKKRNDYLMWLQVIKESGYLYGFEEVLGAHRLVQGSLSSKKTDLIKYHWEVYRKHEELSILKSTNLIFYWIIMTFFKLR